LLLRVQLAQQKKVPKVFCSMPVRTDIPEQRSRGNEMAQENTTTVLDQPEVAEPSNTDFESKQGAHEQPKRATKKIVALIGGVLLILATTLWWWHARQYEDTDDAQVDGHIYPLSARIGGHIAAVNVEEGQFVKAGTVLVEIDPRDYEVAAERAKAEYEDALAEATAANLNVPVSRVGSSSQISGAEAGLERAEAGVTVALKQVEQAKARLIDARALATTANADLKRYAELVAKREISQQQYDQASSAADAANARVSGAEAGLKAAEEQVTQARAHVRESTAELETARVSPKNVSAIVARAKSAEAKVTRAHAALERAELDLSYTKIVAPVDGIIGRRAAQVGQNVQPGQDLMALVPLNEIWITANFKEDQLAHMRAGQHVSIDVDAYDREWHGKVTSIGGATGARFSLLPPENATGNYVKVVQRIPVRIDLIGDANREGLLRPGMSVVPKVRVH
jgi:membrane fusion protein, multidrug efflux system